jgi:hypothetical protein
VKHGQLILQVKIFNCQADRASVAGQTDTREDIIKESEEFLPPPKDRVLCRAAIRLIHALKVRAIKVGWVQAER